MNVILISLLLLYVFSSIAVHISSSLAPRSKFDPYIICTDPFAVPTPPNNYQPYDNYLSLCSAIHGITRKNMGCFCDHPHGTVRCEESRGDPHLWLAATRLVDSDSGRQTLITLYDLCLHVCFCSSAANGRAARNETRRPQESQKSLPSETDSTSGNRIDEESEATEQSSVSTSQQGTEASKPHFPLQSPYQNACGTNCSTNAECQVGRTGCTCKTQKELYVMGKGTVGFLAACMMSLGGKRDEDRPCPCNGTYVSYKCCGTEDGLVWEDKMFKLGELLVRDEM